ncbi:MAG: hypothetical protein NZ480_06860 [Bdellovibrionaceae bacterium]|nr:hypothetical protein [Pseudobdellovibrionaceae bacterium]MDW8190310.1 hypothetical protein [Pseudobdellovibrionaceae bacterium]
MNCLNRLLWTLAILTLAGCRTSFQGSLKLFTALPIQHEVQEPWSEEGQSHWVTSSVNPGDYEFKINIYNARHFELILNPKSWRRQIFNIVSSEDVNLPESGPFYIPGRQIQQTFNISGHVTKTIKDGPLRHELQSCMYQDLVTVCGPKGCEHQWVWKSGYQPVQFNYRFTHIKLVTKFVGDHKEEPLLGQADTQAELVSKVIHYMGECR